MPFLSSGQEAYNVILEIDNQYYMAGQEGPRIMLSENSFIVKTDEHGNVVWRKKVRQLPDSDPAEQSYIIASYTQVFGNKILGDPQEYDYWIVSSQKPNAKIYPNPFREYTILNVDKELLNNPVTLKIYDMTLREILSMPVYRDVMVIRRGSLASGIYYFELITGDIILLREKIIVR
jgi:hypothetical protein